MKASDLLLVNENDIDMLRDRPDIIDPTAVNIHGTIHSKVKDANCILHCHSKYATILSTFADMTLPPIDQTRCVISIEKHITMNLMEWVLWKNQKKWLLA